MSDEQTRLMSTLNTLQAAAMRRFYFLRHHPPQPSADWDAYWSDYHAAKTYAIALMDLRDSIKSGSMPDTIRPWLAQGDERDAIIEDLLAAQEAAP